MNYLHHYEIDWINYLQQWRGPLVDQFFKTLDLFDHQEFLFCLIPILWIGYYWKLGIRLFYLILISCAVNYGLKEFFQQPRPFQLDPTLGVIEVGGFGFPSGAAQSTLLLSSLLIKTWKSPWAWVIGINYVVWVCLSRIYLGVHFPTDILGGWAIGGVIFMMYLLTTSFFDRWFRKQSSLFILLLSQLLPIALLYSYPSLQLVKLAAIASGCGFGIFISNNKKLYLGQSKNLIETLTRSLFAVGGTFSVSHLASQLHLADEQLQNFLQFFLVGIWLSMGASAFYRKISIKSLLTWAHKLNPFMNP
jgi:undecaprenyl-diphosphatase